MLVGRARYACEPGTGCLDTTIHAPMPCRDMLRSVRTESCYNRQRIGSPFVSASSPEENVYAVATHCKQACGKAAVRIKQGTVKQPCGIWLPPREIVCRFGDWCTRCRVQFFPARSANRTGSLKGLLLTQGIASASRLRCSSVGSERRTKAWLILNISTVGRSRI